jgi:hypothetical protein
MIEQSKGLGGNHNLDSFKRRAFELCLAIYRITSLFPKVEVLIGQLRQASSKIVVFLAAGKIRDTILKIEELKIYLEIAKEQKWLAPINFDLLISAYSLLADSLGRPSTRSEERREKRTAIPLPEQETALVNGKKEKEERFIFREAEIRLEKIVEYFNKNKEASVTQLLSILGRISERTVRNDLAILIGRNFIKKTGNKRSARYFLNIES